MRSIKNNKGITLIALIITIVVLLILAVVAINSIQNEGILAHVENSTGTYNNSVSNEKVTLNEYEELMNPCKIFGHKWDKEQPNCRQGDVEATCTVCGETTTLYYKHIVVYDESYGATVCSLCGITEIYNDCNHNIINGQWMHSYEATHQWSGICEHCGLDITPNSSNNNILEGNCDFDTNNTCTSCGFTCTHDNGYGGSYEQIDSLKHEFTCGVCSSTTEENHNFEVTNYTSIDSEKHKVAVTCTECGYETQKEEVHNFVTDSYGYCVCGEMCPTCASQSWDYVRYEEYSNSHMVWFNCQTCGLGDGYGPIECTWSEGETCDQQVCIYCQQQRLHYFENGKCTACNTEHTCSGEKGYDTSMTSSSYYHVCNECGNKEACDPDWENSPYEYGANCKICGGYNP